MDTQYPAPPPARFVSSRVTLGASTYRFMNMLRALVYRDITARYRKSLLGPGWAIVQPLVFMGVFSLLRGVTNIDSEGVPYPIFTFSALVPWTFFSNAVILGAPSVMMNAPVVKKTAIPREVFPLSAVLTATFDLVMSGLILIGMMIYFGTPIGLSIVWLPLLILMTAALAFSIGMLFASLGTFKRDFVIGAPFLMQFWLFVSPIIYPLSQVPEKWKTLYQLNPTVGLIEGFRSVLIRAETPALEPLGWSALVIVVLFIVIWPFFRWISQYFADVI